MLYTCRATRNLYNQAEGRRTPGRKRLAPAPAEAAAAVETTEAEAAAALKARVEFRASSSLASTQGSKTVAGPDFAGFASKVWGSRLELRASTIRHIRRSQ